MRVTERDRLVLKQSLVTLLWLGLLLWAISYSTWLGLAVSALLSTHGWFRKHMSG